MKWCDRNLVSNPMYFGLCLSEKAYLKEMKKMGIKNYGPFIKTPQSDATTHFFVDGKGNESVIVAMRSTKKVDPIAVAGLLVHESVHIWQAIKEHIGESSPSSEFEAYSIQKISQELMWAYRELKKK